MATPITEALKTSGVEEVVAAVASLAETLARIHSLGYHHRDIKPGNLFFFEGGWVLGDFGLVQTPDASDLTQPGRKLGPTNFLPYEALMEPESAEGGPIDVYELAKTLWTLICDVRWPPFGHQALDTGYPIEGYRPHPKARELDRLVDR